MIMVLLVSVWYSVRCSTCAIPRPGSTFLATRRPNRASCWACLGLATGSLWAKYTWGAWWTPDPRLNAAAIALLIYGAYLVLRGSFRDEQQRARVSAIYNIFAFAAAIPLLFILPRISGNSPAPRPDRQPRLQQIRPRQHHADGVLPRRHRLDSLRLLDDPSEQPAGPFAIETR